MFSAYSSFQLLLSAVAYCSLLWVIGNGKLRRSKFALPIAGTIVGLVVGLLLKVQHWSGSGALLIGSGLTLAGLYGAWFARKPVKTRLDVLKLSYAISLGLWALTMGMGWRTLLPWVGSLQLMALWAVLLDFGYVSYVRRPPVQ